MNPVKTQTLFDTFFHLYRGRLRPVQDSLMSFGFECGDGWFDLIAALSAQLEESARQAGLDVQNNSWPEAVQVKQKGGQLRFYLRNATDEMAGMIDEAAVISAHTCEVCGSPEANINSTRRYSKTLCVAHLSSL